MIQEIVASYDIFDLQPSTTDKGGTQPLVTLRSDADMKVNPERWRVLNGRRG